MNKPLGGPIRRRDFMIGMGSAAGISLLGGSAFAQATKRATISEAIHLGFYIPTYVAQRKGLFKKHGFDMAIKSAGGIAQPVPALLSKAAQFAVTGTGMSVNATVEGAQMINIAKIVGYISVWVVAKPGVKFDSVDDFKGKRIATLKYPSNTFTTPTYAMKVIGGYDPEANGVKFLQLPFGAQLQAVADGRADVATVFEWNASIAETQFGLKTVFSLGDTLGPAVFTSTFVPKDYLETNPDSVQRYCNAIAEAQKLLHEDPKVFLEVSTLEFPQIDLKVIEAARARFFGKAPVAPRNPIITEQEWKTIISHEDGAGTIRKQLPFSQMVNNTFAEKAAKEFGLA